MSRYEQEDFVLTESCRYNTAYGNSAWADMNDFAPLAEMEDPNKDLVIVMLWKNSMGYGSPVEDLVFAANDPWPVKTTSGTDDTWYFSDAPAAGIGCTQQVSQEGFIAANYY